MQITKLTTVDAFLAVDLPEATTSVGIVRCARKILQDGAVNLARSLTYSYATFGIATSGASAGINAEGDARDAAVAAFVAELASQVAGGALSLTPGKGVSAADLAAWGDLPAADTDDSLAAGVVAAAEAATALAGATVAVEAGAPAADAIAAAFTAGGADATLMPLADLLAAGRSIVVVGSKAGVLDHENIVALGDATVVGAAGLSFTARALATARRNGATVLPDFVSAAGPLLAAAGENVSARIAAATSAALAHDEGPYLGACYAAEEFLRTWATELPFGRPMA